MASNSIQFGTSQFRGGVSNNNSQNSSITGNNNSNNNTPQNQNQLLSGPHQQASHPFQSQQTTPVQQQEQQQLSQPSSSSQVQYQPGIDNTPTEYAENRSQSPDFMATLMAKLWFDHNVESSLSSLRKEEHEKRMRDLRKQLDYINDTNWKYQPVEKYLGQQ